MPLASSSLAQVRYVEEVTYGTTPATAPDNVRMTGESLAFSLTKTESAEIRPDRQITDLIVTAAGASGGINFELSYKEFDDMIRAALQGAWAYYGVAAPGLGQGVGTAFTGTFTATTLTASVAPTGSSAFTTLAKGQWFLVSGSGTANDGKAYRVSSTVAPTATIITVDAATPMVVGAGGAATKISSARMANGVVQTQFTIERALNDVSQFFAYRGMTLSKMNLKWASGSITSGSFEFMGKDGIRQNATVFTGTPNASEAYDVMNGVSGVGSVMEGGIALAGTFIKSLDLTLENNLRGRDAIGTLGNASIGSGTVKVSGNIEVYLQDGTIYDKFLNNTMTSLQFISKDGAGNGYAFQMPAVKYGDAKVNAGSKDQDVMLSLPFTALMDITTQKTLIIDRFGV
jgi:hypothetical protein